MSPRAFGHMCPECQPVRTSEPHTRRIWSLGFIALLFVFGCNADAPIEISTHNHNDRLRWKSGDIPALWISSPSGIGAATLTAPDTVWPAVIDVYLELTALEGLVVSAAGEVHRLELTSEGRVLLEPTDSQVLQMPLRVVAGSDKTIMVRVHPNNFAEHVSELRLEWVDYYR